MLGAGPAACVLLTVAAMSPARFDAMVARVSELAQREPETYRHRLLGLACLGYGYVLAVLLGLIGIGVALPWLMNGRAGAATVKLELILIGFVLVIVRAMWVAVRPDEDGVPLTRAEFPQLFETVDRVCAATAAPSLHKVLLTGDLNAAVQQVSRFGIFGQRNYLMLGLPLLLLLSPHQFEAVLAHEFGHLSHRHGRFGAWIYRIRAGWSRLVEALDQGQSWLRFLFGPFFRWYAPLFSAYSFVQARAQEHEADRSAAAAYGARHLADALVRVRLAAGFLERRYWPDVFARVEREAQPPANAISSLPAQVATHLASPAAADDLSAAVAEQTTSADTHPCLRERLAALGESARITPPVAEPAAALLGDRLPELARHFDEDWTASVAPQWGERHASACQSRGMLATLLETPEAARSPEQWWELCRLTDELDGEDAALVLCRQGAERFPDHRPTRFALGSMLLQRDDADGLVHMEAAMDGDSAITVQGWERTYEFLRRHGREAEAEALYARAVAADDDLGVANRERARIDWRTRYEPQDLPAAVHARIAAAIAAEPEIARAYLVRKQVARMAERPLYVLTVVRRRRWYRFESGTEDEALATRLLVALDGIPAELQIYAGAGRYQLRRIARVAGSQIHPAPAPVAQIAEAHA